MQPPTYTLRPLRTQLAALRQISQIGHRKPSRENSDRLYMQIAAWCASMSPEERKRRFSLAEVEKLAGLVGNHGGRAANHHMAQALRAVGFTSCRDWTVAGRNRRYWIWSVK